MYIIVHIYIYIYILLWVIRVSTSFAGWAIPGEVDQNGLITFDISNLENYCAPLLRMQLDETRNNGKR